MLLDIEDLTIRLPEGAAARPMLAEVSLRVGRGEVVGLVGESGSGKSTTARAVLRMLPDGARTSGSVRVDGEDVLAMDPARLRRHRSRTVSMIFQDPRSAMNPVRRIGDFLTDPLTRVLGLTRRAAVAKATELLASVGLPDPERRMRQRPHELSGGMLQRVVIAAALSTGPDLLLADEATSALDATTQAEVLALLRGIQEERRQDGSGLGTLFITHDLPLAAAYCDRVYVMYAGRVVEHQPAHGLFADPRHPYTRGLLECSPTLEDDREPRPIPGRPPSLSDAFTGCPFLPRCARAEAECETWAPVPVPFGGGGGGGDGPEEGGSADGVSAACRRLELVSRSST
ncbi:ABC transporter ATP-binding protein [Streptomyces sp. 11-1-2]|uniref:ABC transporter ATP-binding protein n=1 Tax=unclassified Streptomyces TaxID=2593676 RepID=UPI000B8D94E4|nr:ABC transporter ATP-binding protein [Streptomyces sp. 11-1-2]ASQ97928.1 ABC transporter ATP-binding protein [Streptomyces sp. 11-1-2]